MTRIEKSAAASGGATGQAGRGRGARGFGARVVGVLLLALAAGLGYAGFDSGIREPFMQSNPGTITVERCSHEDGRRVLKECAGLFTSNDGKVKDPYADVETDEPHAKGHRLDVTRLGVSSYTTSTVDAVASGLRPLFAGIGTLSPALFCLVVGRWPSPRSAPVLRTMHPAFSWFVFPVAGFGLLGLFLAGVVKWLA